MTQDTLDRIAAVKRSATRRGVELTPEARVRLWYAKPRLQALLNALPGPRGALP